MNTTRSLLKLSCAIGLTVGLQGSSVAQILLEEHFTGGASTTGFTIESVESDCDWVYAPGALTETMFSQDGAGQLPSGGGFDGDFAFIDSDACGDNSVVVNTTLVSPPFDASGAAVLNLSYSHQFQARLESFCKVEVFDGTAWNEVALYTETSVGYPNPAAQETLDITAAAGGSAVCQVRFQFSSGWDWWWALDNIVVTSASCAYPSELAVADITTSGATVSWQDNGSMGYEWIVTTGAVPDGSNAAASGSGSSLVASGLDSGTSYAVFIRSLCQGGGTSAWSSGIAFTTLITNDECAQATPLTVNTDYECGDVTPGTVAGATASGITTTCFGTPDDDVWFTFTALTTTHRVSLIDRSGSATDLYHALWTGSCDGLQLVDGSCSDNEESNPVGLVAGQDYYLQVYTWTGTPEQNTTFNVCIGSDPSIGLLERGMEKPLVLYPNPVNDRLTLGTLDVRAQRVAIFDATGRSVMQEPAAGTIDVQRLTTGTYLLVLIARDGYVMGRAPFVKD